MSTAHGQPGLSSDQRSTIRSTILSSRRTLEDELRRQLEKYGIYEDKKLPLDNLAHLSADELHTRKKLDAAIERELESTEGDLERSITNYVREATKTYLNRFVALKTIEVRELVEETITERAEYGNRSYMHHTVAEVAGELTDAPDDGFGAALDLAYQEIGAEIRMIFEESEHTVIDLDAQIREQILDDLDAIDDEAWESDEALGWVYQYFGEEEREDIDDRVDEENYKIAGTDIATKTQLFTPRYIVEWMVDNSLGRTWLEMQGERTNIDDEDNCFYLAPLEESLIDRETKPVEDITVLDPACGSGHMLFYAFDVLYQMYLEEGKVLEKHIPREILRNNLYGVDIDSGAAQIAALSLYLKAKEKSPNETIPQLNIVSADAVLINGNRKQEILDRARSDLEEEVLEQIWRSFEHIREFGSLVQVEERIDEILEEQKDTIKESGQVEFTEDGSFATQTAFVSDEGGEESWQQVKNRLLEEVSTLAADALDRNDPIEEMFAGEVGKTVELLDVLVRDYDVVVSNPPYLGSRKMGEQLKQYLKNNFVGHRNTYTSFIQRCKQLAKSEGYATLVTPEDFMTLYSFRKLREWLLSNNQLIEGAHLSGHSFDTGDRPFTIPFVLKNSDPSNFEQSRFYRMTHEQEKYHSHEDKIRGLNEIAEANNAGKSHNDVYIVNQNIFTKIDRYPFVYWFGSEILRTFENYKQLGDIAEAVNGLTSGDDDLFTRNWWEVDEEIGDRYKWFMLSGDNSKYYYSPDRVLDWGNSGEKIKSHDDSYPRNVDYYGRSGINFRRSSKRFTARYHPKNHFFGTQAHFVDVAEEEQHIFTGYLCSSFVRFILQGLNPGLDFQVGDAKRIPIPDTESFPEIISSLSEKAVEIQKKRSQYIETKREFDSDLIVRDFDQFLKQLELYESDIEVIHGIIDIEVFDLLNLSQGAVDRILDENVENLSKYPHITNVGQLSESHQHANAYISSENMKPEEYDGLVSDITELKGESIRAVSEELEISPYTVAEIRASENIYSSDKLEERSGRLLSYILGSAFGRWSSPETINDIDEIMPITDKSETLSSYISESIQSLFDEPNQVTQQIESDLQRTPGAWMKNRFFRHHHTDQYKRRGQVTPIYWQLESSNGAFSCFIYYHEIDSNTLPKLRGQYLDKQIDQLENELETLTAQTSGDNPEKQLLKRKEEVQNNLNDIQEFRNTIDEMIDDGITVDVEKGIWENIKEWDQYEVLETGLPKLKSSYSR
jgi:type I restriction-modification system DNA methylase subunit